MAKPSKFCADYFPHDADMRNDIKIKALRRRFSLTGYAVWCLTLESMTASDRLQLDFSEINRELLAADFDITEEQLTEVIEYCCRLNLFQRSEDGNTLSCATLKRRLGETITQKIAKSEARREAGRLGGLRSAETRRQKALSDETGKGNEATFKQDEANEEFASSKTNLRKEEKRKEEKKEKESMAYPYDAVAASWNAICSSLPKVVKLNNNRRAKMKSRFNEWGDNPDEMTAKAEEIFSRVAASAFLCGDNHQHWTATFDWLFENPTNWVKVIEGNYDSNRGSHRQRTQGDIKLGVGEFIDETGRRTYGTGKATIPLSAPPRPSDRYSWSAESQTWIML